MDDSITPWPEPTEDSNSHEEGGSRLLGSLLFLDFSSTNENSEFKKRQSGLFSRIDYDLEKKSESCC